MCSFSIGLIMGYGNVINIINYLLYVYIPNRAQFVSIGVVECSWRKTLHAQIIIYYKIFPK